MERESEAPQALAALERAISSWKARRRKLGMRATQAALAEEMGVHEPDITRWKKGVRRIPHTMLVRLAQTLEVSADELLGIAAIYPEGVRESAFQGVGESTVTYGPSAAPSISPLESFERSLAELRTYIGVLESENRRLGGADAVESARRRSQEIISRERRLASRGSLGSKSGES